MKAPTPADKSLWMSVLFGDEEWHTEESGMPYIDDNRRTQVPLRATMECIGAQ